MKIWFDLCHPPHVHVLAPLIRELNRLGHETVITVRDRFQVSELCDLADIKHHKIGRDYGRLKILKAIGILIRTMQLYKFTRKRNLNVAVSHGSEYQLLTAFLLRIPSLFMIDYENCYLGIGKRFATKIVMPETIHNDVLIRKRLNLNKVIKYPGFKEDVYLEDFKPDPGILNELNINSKKIIVALRPPATEAHYHNPESEQPFSAVMSYLIEKSNLTTVILPRTIKEKEKIQKLYNGNSVIIPSRVINGLNLIWHSDLIISGGGTMNREAAVLGVPAYSIFKGQIGAIDYFLEKTGRLHFIESISDIGKIKIEKRRRGDFYFHRKQNLKFFLVEKIISTALDNSKIGRQ